MNGTGDERLLGGPQRGRKRGQENWTQNFSTQPVPGPGTVKMPLTKHRRSKSDAVDLSDDAAVIVKGTVARESTVFARLLNSRYAVLSAEAFATFRREADDAPSKVWLVTKDILVSDVSGSEYHVRHPGVNTFWAMARGAYDTRKMWSFTVTWSSLLATENLTLAFETEANALEWRAGFEKAIQMRAAMPPKARGVSNRPGVGSSSDATFHRGASDSGLERIDGVDGVDVLQGSASMEGDGSHTKRSWASLLHINGISVYVEELDENGGGGALMVSAVVRAPPSDVTSHLVRVRKTEGLAIFAGARTLKVVDDHTHIIGQRWTGSGVLGRLTAPREIVLLRTWRKDPDGTYIVLYQSTNHVAMRRQKGRWWSLSTPVRVDVEAAGFTVAPLLPKYAPVAAESQESLVTLVLKADLGGVLSGGSAAGRLLSPLQGIGVKSMLEPVVTSIVVLRDQVEQNRFVVRPLSHALDVEPDVRARDVAPIPSGREFARTTTMLVYRDRKTLAEAQVEMKEERVRGMTPKPSTAAVTGHAAFEEGPPDLSWAIAGSCPKKYWLCPGNCNFKVRGKNYLVDKKKISAAVPMFELVAVDLLEMEEPIYHICKHLPAVEHSPAPFLFCVQMMVPASPPVSLVCSWAAPYDMTADPADLVKQFEKDHGPIPENIEAFLKAITEFVAGDGPESDAKRNERFKLIPNIARGSWIIKQSVGTTPVLLGKKLATKYYRGKNYFEVDVDIGANSVAASITNLVCGATKSLAIDMGVLIEGRSEDTLPEQLIGTVRLDALDLKSAAFFDEGGEGLIERATIEK